MFVSVISCNTFANVDIFINVRGKKSHGFTSFLPCPPYFPFNYKGETKGMEKGNNKDFYIFTGMNNNTEFLKLPKVWHDMTPTELKVYVVIFDMWEYMKNKEGFFFRSIRQLCNDCGMTNKTITKAINGLVNKGYITTYCNRTQFYKVNTNTDKFVMIPKMIWKELDKIQFKVYVVMRDLWQLQKNEEGFFRISYNEVSKRCNITRATIIQTIRFLRVMEYIKTTKTDTTNTPFYYTFNVESGIEIPTVVV